MHHKLFSEIVMFASRLKTLASPADANDESQTKPSPHDLMVFHMTSMGK